MERIDIALEKIQSTPLHSKGSRVSLKFFISLYQIPISIHAVKDSNKLELFFNYMDSDDLPALCSSEKAADISGHNCKLFIDEDKRVHAIEVENLNLDEVDNILLYLSQVLENNGLTRGNKEAVKRIFEIQKSDIATRVKSLMGSSSQVSISG